MVFVEYIWGEVVIYSAKREKRANRMDKYLEVRS